MRNEIEMFRPQRKNPLVTLTNVALVAVAAGIATALGRELQVGLVAVPREPMERIAACSVVIMWSLCKLFQDFYSSRTHAAALKSQLPSFGTIVCRARHKVSAKQNPLL